MRACATVGIHNDLATSQTAIALRATNHELAGGVHQEAGFLGQQVRREAWTNDVFDHSFVNVFLGHFRRVLSGQHHSVHFGRTAIHVAEGHLGFGVRAQPGQTAIFAQLALALHQTVCVPDRSRHQIRGFVARVAKHQPLVASALVQQLFWAAIHTLGDIGRLLVIGHQNGAGLVINAVIAIVIANALDGVTGNLDVIHVGVRGDLASNTCLRILLENSVQDSVGDLVSYLVGVAFRNGFGCKEKVVVVHSVASLNKG